ncbi:MAG TPA: hypothetical protein VMS12_12055 [Thermoanaerobaculia bacterium]|nr:hypothetical protein [Thermoanaerobaculia bacterium]
MESRRQSTRKSFDRIREMNREDLDHFFESTLPSMLEEEALAVMKNHYCSAMMLAAIARETRLTSHASVRRALVSHRLTPQGQAMKFVHYLRWHELLRLSTDVMVPPPVRRAIEDQMKIRLAKVTLGEKISSAGFCSRELARALLREKDARIFAALLRNQRMPEEYLLVHIDSEAAGPEHLRMISEHPKWSCRYSIRRAIAMNPRTPRAVAASVLVHLKRTDLEELRKRPQTSRYLLACMERLGLLDEGPPSGPPGRRV